MGEHDVVERLWQARAQGDFSPRWLVGTLSLDEALEVQLGLLERKERAGARLGGWKVGLTSDRARAALGSDARPFGHVLEPRILPSGAIVPYNDIDRPTIEPEMCFVMGERLAGPHPSEEEVLAAVATAGAGFEINEARRGSARPDFAVMVTDCLTNWGIVAGSGRPPLEVASLDDVVIRLTCNGRLRWEGRSGDEVDRHVASLQRLVANLHAHGRALEVGQHVITGAFCRFPLGPGEHWCATFSDLGVVEVHTA